MAIRKRSLTCHQFVLKMAKSCLLPSFNSGETHLFHFHVKTEKQIEMAKRADIVIIIYVIKKLQNLTEYTNADDITKDYLK